MSSRFYRSTNLNIERMAQDVASFFFSQGYQAQHINNREQVIVQVRKGGDLEALLGMQAALTMTLQRLPNGVMVNVGEQQWIDKAAAGVLGALIFFPLLITASAGAIMQANLESQALSVLDSAALRQSADVQIVYDPQYTQQPGPPPAYSRPPNAGPPPAYSGQPNAGPPPTSAPTPKGTPEPGSGPIAMPGHGQKQCPRCLAVNDADDAFCSRCGMTVAAQKKYCASCKAELKTDAAFCSKCGVSVAR